MKSEDYINAVNNMKIPDEISGKRNLKERKIMLKKRFAIAAAAAAMAVGIAAYAASNGIISGWYSGSSSVPEYKALPTAEQCIKDAGFEPTLIESFSNGYAFSGGHIVKNNLTDENNKSIEKFKSFDFTYSKDGDSVYFNQDKYKSQSAPKNAEDIAANQNGVDIYYSSYMNKCVPPDYTMTDEDKKAEESGELVFSYGSSEVEYTTVSTAEWQVGDMHYSLMQLDGKLSKDQLVEIAKEIIGEKSE